MDGLSLYFDYDHTHVRTDDVTRFGDQLCSATLVQLNLRENNKY